MKQDELKYREEALTKSEKRKLLRRFLGVLAVGSLMGVFLVYFMNFFHESDGFQGIAIGFEIFFFAILLFIVGIHALNAFQKTKRIYTGIITDKYGQSTKFRNSSQSQYFHIRLDDVEFRIDQFLFDKCHKGELTELHVLGKSRIFEVVSLQGLAHATSENPENEHPIQHQPELEKAVAQQLKHLELKYRDLSEPLTSDESALLTRKLIRALIFRGLIGFAVGVLVFFALSVVFLIAIHLRDKSFVDSIRFFYYLIWCFCIGLFLLINLRTIKLIRDLLFGKSVHQLELVLDLERSNMPKPSRHSTVTYQGYSYRSDLFFYLRTKNFWVQISPEMYDQLKTGDPVVIRHSRYAKEVFAIRSN